ncbi:MAG: glycosyltransferase family 10 domain-containing protein [Phycisphaerales bacterium JB040]
MPARPRTIGLFQWRMDWADLWLSQCEGPLGFEPCPGGRSPGIELRPGDRSADHLLLIGPPVSASGQPRLGYLARKRAKLSGRYDAERGALAIEALRRPREDLTMLVYEPPAAFSDAWFEMARERCSAVYAPDERATHPVVLPATWSFDERLASLRGETPPPLRDRPLDVVCVTSGKSMFPGHDRRLAFLRDLRKAGVSLELFGRGLPADLRGRGPVLSKATVLRAAKLTLAIENEDTEDRYVSEKLWDPIVCGSVPLYSGGRAPETLGVGGSLVRVPDFGEAGVEAVRDAASHAGEVWEAKRSSIMDARARALGDLRLVSWAALTLG